MQHVSHWNDGQCSTCHNTDKPSNHWGQCSTCHNTINWGRRDSGQTDCASCHTSDKPANHFAGQCSTCHNTSNWGDATSITPGRTDCMRRVTRADKPAITLRDNAAPVTTPATGAMRPLTIRDRRIVRRAIRDRAVTLRASAAPATTPTIGVMLLSTTMGKPTARPVTPAIDRPITSRGSAASVITRATGMMRRLITPSRWIMKTPTASAPSAIRAAIHRSGRVRPATAIQHGQ